MPKNISAPFLAFLQSGQTLTLATLVQITRADGTVMGFTDHDESITYGGVDFEAMDGASLSAISSDAASPSSSEASGIISSSRITDEDLRAGIYNQAQITTMMCNWADLSMGVIILQSGFIGEIHSEDGAWRVELRGLSDLLRQRVGISTLQTCRACLLGDLQCKVNLSGYTFSRTVTAINQSVTDASPTDVLRINCGGGATGSWAADEMYSGNGYSDTTSHAIDTSEVTNPAPEAVYQSFRTYHFTYTLTGLTPSTNYLIRIHLCDFNNQYVGKRQFSVYSGSLCMIYMYDTILNAGSQFTAVVPYFYTTSDSSGTITLQFDNGIGSSICNGIEVLTVSQGSITSGICIGSDSNPSGYYTYGLVTWTSGQNKGLVFEVANHIRSGGNAYLSFRLPPPYPIAPGDTLSIVAGCDRNYQTCMQKFGNSVNFHGEPFLPGNDLIMQVGLQQS